MNMGERIKERRIELGMTQEDLAVELGLQKSAIAKYENGRVENIKRTTIIKMANILHCTPAYLLGFDDNDASVAPSGYYTDPETARLAQEMFEDPEMRSLFHMKRNMEPEKFQAHYDMMKKLYDMEHPEESDDFYGC